MSTSAEPTVGNPFLALWRLGYRFTVPIIPHDALIAPTSHIRPQSRGKAPGVLWDAEKGWWGGIKDWQTREPTEHDIERWHAMGAGCGIRMGRQHDGSFLYGLDADTLHHPSSGTILDFVERIFGKSVPVRIGKSPKALYLVRTRDPIPYRVLRFAEGALEVLGEGKQAVAVGIHPGTGLPYRFTRNLLPLAEMPLHDAADIETLLRELRVVLPKSEAIKGSSGGDRAKVNQRTLIGDPDMVSRAMAAIPNRYSPGGYDEWVKTAVALRAALPDDYGLGLELFEDWTDKGGCPDPVESAPRVFGSIEAPFSVGASWLYERAAQQGAGQFNVADPFFDADAAAKAAENEAGGTESSISLFGGSSPRPRLVLERFDAVADQALTSAGKPLIRGLLDQGTMSVLYGESNAGKTFVTMDVAYHVAAGLAWGGMKVTQCAAIYVAAEGGNGAAKRAGALRAKYGPCEAFQYLRFPVNLLDPAADLEPLIELLRPTPDLGLVVLDTLARVMAGGDENSSVDMGTLVRHVDAIRAATGAHVLIVHHTGKDLARGARGHSSLRAATDTEIEVVPGRISVTKQRDMEGEFQTGFDLEPVTLGVTGEGDPVSSCTIKLRPVGAANVEQSVKERTLGEVRKGEWRLDVRAPGWIGIPMSLGLGLDMSNDEDKKTIRKTVSAWIKDGALEQYDKLDKSHQSRVYVRAKAAVLDLFQ